MLKAFHRYLIESFTYVSHSPNRASHIFMQLLDYNKSPLELGKPWITYEAYFFLLSHISSSTKVFEYGSGGSTAFFAKRAKLVISVEHDRKWYKIVSSRLRALSNTQIVLRPPEKRSTFPRTYTSTSDPSNSFKKYVKEINQFPDHFFDIVFIDGRSREWCIKESRTKVKPGGFMILDNSDRKRYRLAVKQYIKDWDEIVFSGPVIGDRFFSSTSVFKSPFQAQ